MVLSEGRSVYGMFLGMCRKYGQAMHIAPHDFRAYTKYERNHAAVRLSVIRINSKKHFGTEIRL